MADYQLTFANLKWLWEFVGGPTGEADLAASIAMAESHGCQFALAGPKDIRPQPVCLWTVTHGENSCGFWQVNLYAHPTYSAPGIFDPFTNARAALAISSHGASWSPWSTYNNGAYKTYLAQYAGAAPVNPYDSGGGSSGGDGGAGGLGVDGVPPGGWSHGWNNLSNALARDVPRGVATSVYYRRATLRALAHRRRVR